MLLFCLHNWYMYYYNNITVQIVYLPFQHYLEGWGGGGGVWVWGLLRNFCSEVLLYFLGKADDGTSRSLCNYRGISLLSWLSFKTLINIYLKKQKVMLLLVDYRYATGLRTELWSKRLNRPNNLSGKLFQIIYNMYRSAKSCVSVNSTLTEKI